MVKAQYSDAHSPFHPAHQCVLKESGKPRERRCLFALYHNFVRIHEALKVTPAIAAEVTERLWEIDDIVDVLEAWEAAQKDV